MRWTQRGCVFMCANDAIWSDLWVSRCAQILLPDFPLIRKFSTAYKRLFRLRLLFRGFFVLPSNAQNTILNQKYTSLNLGSVACLLSAPRSGEWFRAYCAVWLHVVTSPKINWSWAHDKLSAQLCEGKYIPLRLCKSASRNNCGKKGSKFAWNFAAKMVVCWLPHLGKSSQNSRLDNT